MMRPQPLARICGGGSTCVKGGGQVDRDDAVPLFDWKVFHPLHVLDTRIIDQNIGTAEGFGRLSHKVAALVGIRHVSGDIDRARAMFFAMDRASAWSSSRLVKELITTLCPAAASAWAMPSPMPEFDPVTIAVLRAVVSVMFRFPPCIERAHNERATRQRQVI